MAAQSLTGQNDWTPPQLSHSKLQVNIPTSLMGLIEDED